MIDAYRNSLDEKERIELSRRIQEKVFEDGSFVPTFMIPYFRQVYWRWWRFPDPPATRSTEGSEGGLFTPFSTMTGGLFWFDPDLYNETRAAMADGKAFEPEVILDETYKP
ncbi:MAG: hypothetical protein P8Z37_10440 [Acidobacteriota bacterium]